MSQQPIDPKAWLDAVDEQWNSHNLDGAMAFFTDEATARFIPPLPGAPEVAYGQEQIRPIVQSLFPGFHVHSTNHKLAGNRVTWSAEASNDAFRQMGIGSVTAEGEAILEGNQMSAFTIAFTPETVRKLQAALAAVPV
jgi:hypothetical protein